MQSCAKYKLTMKTSLQHLQMPLALPSDESSSEALYVRPQRLIHHGAEANMTGCISLYHPWYKATRADEKANTSGRVSIFVRTCFLPCEIVSWD